MRRFARPAWVLRLSLALVLVGGLVVLAGQSEGVPARAVPMDDGTAWLVSSAVGQAALIDGSSAQVVTRVPVGRGELSSAQSGTDAFVANTTDGTVLRVDGARFEASDAVRFASPGQPLAVYPAAGAVFAIGEVSGLVTTADPDTLQIRGQQSLGARVSAGAALADTAGRLWLIDGDSGDLIRLDGHDKRVRRGAAHPTQARLVAAGGRVVVVDLAGRTARTLDADGAPESDTCVDTQPGDDTVVVAGSPSGARVYAASGRRGLLLISDLSSGSCDIAVDLAAAGHELGQPREAAGRVFIPDFTTGQVIVVDVMDRRLVARSDVLPPGTRFELLGQGSFVFFNDPGSSRAGTVRLDGTVQKIEKYDQDDPGSGVSGGPGTDPGPSPGPPDPSQPTTPAPSTPAAPPPTAPPAAELTPPEQPRPGDIRIEVSAAQAQVGQEVRMRVVTADGPAVASVTWTFGDGTSAAGVQVGHAWSAPGDYLVGAQTILSDGRQVFPTTRITVTQATPPDPDPEQAPPVARLTVRPAAGPAPLQVTVDASASTAGSAPISGYSFDFGDGATASGATATHTYQAAGTFTVAVTVNDEAGMTARQTQTISVNAPASGPVSRLSVSPATGGAPLRVTADASGSSAGSAAIASYTFRFGGAVVGPQGAATAAFTFDTPGTYPVSVTVTDSAGRTDDSSQSVTVAEVTGPTARVAVAPASGAAPLNVTADGSASAAGSSPITQYSFNFGDGSVASGSSAASHTYAAGGTFTVTLTVTDQAGRTDIQTASVTVTESQPGIATSVTTTGLSAVGRRSDVTISNTGAATLNIVSMTEATGESVGNECAGAAIPPGGTCTFTVGWSGGPGSSPPGPRVTIISNAPTSPTVVDIPWQ